MTFQDNQAILDLPDTNLSSIKCTKIIAEIERLLQEETPASMSWSEKLAFVLENRGFSPIAPSDVEVLTRVNDEVISLTNWGITGDIRYHSTSKVSSSNHEFISKIHQATMRLLMKKWRDQIIQTQEIISSVLMTINKLQTYSSIIGSLGFLTGIFTDTPSYLMLSLIPFIATGVLAVFKRTI